MVVNFGIINDWVEIFFKGDDVTLGLKSDDFALFSQAMEILLLDYVFLYEGKATLHHHDSTSIIGVLDCQKSTRRIGSIIKASPKGETRSSYQSKLEKPEIDQYK